MSNTFTNQTQPSTGSSQNALKRGFHAVALQHGEDAQEVQDLQQQICAEYAVNSELDRFLVSQLVQNMLMLGRIHRYRESVITAALYEPAAKHEFKVTAQLSPVEFLEVPDGLLSHDPALVARGVQVADALIEVAKLKECITYNNAPQMLATLSTHSPHILFELKRLGLVHNEDAGRFFGSRYGNRHVLDNLKEFTNELTKSNKVALLWAQNEQKFLDIIASIKAKATLELLKDPNLSRYETGCFNKIRSLRADLQIKKDAQILEAKAIDVTERASGLSRKGAKVADAKKGSAKEAGAIGTPPKGSGSAQGSNNQPGDVTDVQDKSQG